MKSRRKKPIKVFAAGCFNRIHQGHVRMLRQARALGDSLTVVLANDAHNRKPNAVSAAIRQAWMRELELADEVVIGAPDSFAKTVERENPSIIVLGYDQRLPDEATTRAVAERGIEVVQLPWYPGKDETLKAA